MSKKKNRSATPVPEEESIIPIPDAAVIDEPTVVNEPEFITGTVVGCRKLNVREQMHTEAPVLCELRVSSEVQIFADEHHDDWYHVITASGVDGFCMKQYISINC